MYLSTAQLLGMYVKVGRYFEVHKVSTYIHSVKPTDPPSYGANCTGVTCTIRMYYA